MEWLDRALANQRLGRATDRSVNEYWVAPPDAGELYQQVGRSDDALAVWQRAYAQSPTPEAWRSLLDLAAALGREDEIRAWAVATAEEQASRTNGAALITIYLAAGEFDQAWEVAEAYGPASAWQALAQSGGSERAIEAAGLYRDAIEVALQQADIRSYRQVAALLLEMRKLPGADQEAFDAYVADIKHRFARRPTFIKALRDKRL